MSPKQPNSAESLQGPLGYRFNDDLHLQLALTHRSYGKPNNERLEFLGDSLLNYIIGSALFHTYPMATEGELSKMRSHLVCGEFLAKKAQAIGVGPYLRLGGGEAKSGGRQRASLLADAFESIVGAIFSDSNISTCEAWVLNCFKEDLLKASIETQKDAKTELQEWLQANKFPLPTYTLIKEVGKDHDKWFTVRCELPSHTLKTEATARSVRSAGREAASNMLKLINKKALNNP